MKLNEAITANNIDEVRKFVQKRKKPFNISFLIEAISLERREIIEILIAHTSNFDVILDTGCSALEVAVDIGDIETVKRLLKAGADPDFGNPLITAVRKKNYDIITTLTSAGASTTLQDGSDVSALSLATLQGDLKALKLMINDQNVLTVKDEYERTLLEIAAANGHVDIFEHILPYFADKEKEKEKCREILSLGIKRKERLLDSDSNCFFEAIDSGQVDVIRDFLSSGKSPDMLNITHIPLVMEGRKQLRNRCREQIVTLAGKRKEL
jgi:ankyrin repeat protein